MNFEQFNDMDPGEAVQLYAKLNLAVFPCHHISDTHGCTCKDPDCGSVAKHPFAGIKRGKKFTPVAPNGLKDATTEKTRIKDWWFTVPRANVGLPTGKVNQLLVIDVDPEHGGMDSLAKLEEETGLDLKNQRVTLTQRTPSGGVHLVFSYAGDDLGNRQGMLPGIDVRGEGGYIVVSPSRTLKGRYAWVNDMEPVPLPAPLRDYLLSDEKVERERKRQVNEWHLPEKVERGRIHDVLIGYGGAMRAWGMSKEEIFQSIRAIAETRAEVMPSDAELRRWAASLERYPVDEKTGPVQMLRQIAEDRPEILDSFLYMSKSEERRVMGAAAPTAPQAPVFRSLPDDVFPLLPDDLARICSLIEEKHERDLFLTGALAVLAGCSPNGFIRYGGVFQGLNLYFCVVCEAGGGKSKIRLAQRLGEIIDDQLVERSTVARAKWERAKEEGGSYEDDEEEDEETGEEEMQAAGDAFEAMEEQIAEELPSEDPAEKKKAEEKKKAKTPAHLGDGPPPFYRFFFGGDASGREIKNALSDNPTLLIFETEIKTLFQSLKMEWGSFRDVLLKAFHAERVQMERQGAIPKVIRRPALSMCLTGTPGSFEEFIKDTEDGLFSRTCFYSFDSDPEFVDQFGDFEGTEAERLVDRLAEQMPQLYGLMKTRTTPLYFKMRREDQERINAAGKAAMDALMQSGADMNLQANIKRSAVVAFRIASLMALFRAWREGGADLYEKEEIYCSHDDVTVGLRLAFSYLEHALKLSEMMKEGGHDLIRSKRTDFFVALPDGHFSTKMAYQIGNRLRIKERSVYNYLYHFAEKGLVRKMAKDDWYKVAGSDVGKTPSFYSLLGDLADAPINGHTLNGHAKNEEAAEVTNGEASSVGGKPDRKARKKS